MRGALKMVLFMVLGAIILVAGAVVHTATDTDIVAAEWHMVIETPPLPSTPVAETPVATPAPEQFAMRQEMYIIGDKVRERSGPDISYDEIRVYIAGQTVVAVGEQGGWWKLSDGGFIRKDLLTTNRKDIVTHFVEMFGDILVVSSAGQKAELWLGGELAYAADVIVGDSETPTPSGLHSVYGCAEGVDMYGKEEYHAKWVSYLAVEGRTTMVAVHDAPWLQGAFGAGAYQINGGSHGCINAPDELAKAVYDYGVGLKVLVLP